MSTSEVTPRKPTVTTIPFKFSKGELIQNNHTNTPRSLAPIPNQSSNTHISTPPFSGRRGNFFSDIQENQKKIEEKATELANHEFTPKSIQKMIARAKFNPIKIDFSKKQYGPYDKNSYSDKFAEFELLYPLPEPKNVNDPSKFKLTFYFLENIYNGSTSISNMGEVWEAYLVNYTAGSDVTLTYNPSNNPERYKKYIASKIIVDNISKPEFNKYKSYRESPDGEKNVSSHPDFERQYEEVFEKYASDRIYRENIKTANWFISASIPHISDNIRITPYQPIFGNNAWANNILIEMVCIKESTYSVKERVEFLKLCTRLRNQLNTYQRNQHQRNQPQYNYLQYPVVGQPGYGMNIHSHYLIDEEHLYEYNLLLKTDGEDTMDPRCKYLPTTWNNIYPLEYSFSISCNSVAYYKSLLRTMVQLLTIFLSAMNVTTYVMFADYEDNKDYVNQNRGYAEFEIGTKKLNMGIIKNGPHDNSISLVLYDPDYVLETDINHKKFLKFMDAQLKKIRNAVLETNPEVKSIPLTIENLFIDDPHDLEPEQDNEGNLSPKKFKALTFKEFVASEIKRKEENRFMGGKRHTKPRTRKRNQRKAQKGTKNKRR